MNEQNVSEPLKITYHPDLYPRELVSALQKVRDRYKVGGLYGLNRLSKEGDTHIDVSAENVSYHLWSIGWFEQDNREKVNATVIIVDSGKQIEPEYLHNDATTLHLESVQGSGRVVVSDPDGKTYVHEITPEMKSPIEIKPGSVYAVFANGDEPLILLDYCDPPYKPGMETPVVRNSSISDIEISEEFWTKCDQVARMQNDSGS